MQNLILNQIGFLDHPAISKQLKVCGDVTKSDVTDSDVMISNVTEFDVTISDHSYFPPMSAD